MLKVECHATVQRVRMNKLESGRTFTNVDLRCDDLNGRPIFASIVYRDAAASKAHQTYRKGDELDVQGELLNNSFKKKDGEGWINSLRIVPSSLSRTARGPEVGEDAAVDGDDDTPMPE